MGISSSPTFFPEHREYRSAPRASKKLPSRLGLRAAPADLGRGERAACTLSAAYLPTFLRRRAANYQRARTHAPDRRRGILLCSDFSEHTHPPFFAGDGPPALARLSHQVSLACTPATGDSVAIGAWSVPRPARTTVRTRAERW